MKNIFILFLGFLLAACSGTKKNVKELYGLPVETIDFHKFEIKKLADLPVGIWEDEFILLSATKAEDLFARSEKIRIKDGKIYVYDRRAAREHYLQVYDRHGNAMGQVGRRGNGPGEYIHITDFDIADNGDIFLMDAYMGSVVMHRFDANFRFINKKQLPFQADLFTCLPNNQLFFSLATWNSGIEKGNRILVTDKDLNPVYSGMKYEDNYDNAYSLSGYSLIKTDNKILLHKPVEDYIYILNENGQPEKIYEIDMGAFRVPVEARTDVESHLNDFEKYKYLYNFVWINNRYIIGKIADRNQVRMFVADRSNRICYQSDPITDSAYTYLIGFENGEFISYVESDHYIAEKDNFDHFPEHVKEHLATDNPVLHIRKFK